MSGLIKRTIENKNKEVMLRLYKSLVCPHVDYTSHLHRHLIMWNWKTKSR